MIPSIYFAGGGGCLCIMCCLFVNVVFSMCVFVVDMVLQ